MITMIPKIAPMIVEADRNRKVPVFVLIGHPYCGKSVALTRATLYLERTDYSNVVKLDSDSYIKRFAADHNMTYSDAFDEYAKEATRLYKQSVVDAGNEPYESDKIIFIDRTNMSVGSRKHIINGFWNRRDYSVIAVVFPFLDKETLDTRMEDREGQYVPMNVIEGMKNRFEEPTKAEGFDEIVYL